MISRRVSRPKAVALLALIGWIGVPAAHADKTDEALDVSLVALLANPKAYAAQSCPRMHAINVRQHTGQLPTIHRRAPDAQEDHCDTGDVHDQQKGDQDRARPATGHTNRSDGAQCGEEAEENGAGSSPFALLRHLSRGAEG